LGLFLSLLILGCSESRPNKQEQRYLDTADSLKRYADLPDVKAQLDTSEMIKDIVELSFDEFKNKYDVDDNGVDVFSLSVLTTIEIAKTFQSIEESIMDIESLNLDEIRSDFDTISDDYSFNKGKELSLDRDKVESGSDSEFEYTAH